MREHQLRAAATFFDNNNKYNTWLAPPHPSTGKRQAYQLDHFLIPKYQLCQTTNVKRKFDGATSDHAALQIDFYLLNTPLLRKKEAQKGSLPTQTIDNKILRNQELSNFQKGVQNFFDNLQPDTMNFQSPTELLSNFESHIVQTAVDVAAKKKKKRPDWFSESEQTLVDLIEKRNKAFKLCMKQPSSENQNHLKETRKELLRQKRIAKRNWQLAYASRCKKADFCITPKEAWSMVFKLMEGFQGHHRNYLPPNFRNKNGIEAKNDADNAQILNSHFQSLFNSEVQVDMTVLDNLPQYNIVHNLGDVPTHHEIKKAIANMKYDKAPGQSGLTTDMVKSLPTEALNFLTQRIQDFWENPDVDYDTWHTTILSTIYKGKGDPQDPNNHRGIALKETSAKILSIILADRLLTRLRQINPITQFGHIGCQEAQHTIKRALLLRRQHGLESHAIFIDLVKAFDTVNHELLCQILSKYGLPAPIVNLVRKLYNNCQVKIKVGAKFTEISYTTGVHQGDNMSPVLFLFVIQAFLETLQLTAQPAQFTFFPDNKNNNSKTQKGRLLSQNTTAKGNPFFFNSSFYVDDSFFLFQSRSELHQAITEINEHFSRFGLTMHLGSGTVKAKSEAMYFPPSLKLAKYEFVNNILPDDIILENGKKVHYVNKFKYLGSFITPLLNEDYEIDMRIKKAKSIMGAAKHFFNNKDVDKRIKAQIYVAGPLNALLWGCETWNLTKYNLNKLMSFHHSAIRRILGIRWDQVREKHIKNKEVRGLLCNIPNIDAYIVKRTATYIGKISRTDVNSYPKKFLAAWIVGKRKSGAPQLTCNNNFANSIKKILPTNKVTLNKQAILREWMPLAKDQSSWLQFIDEYFESCRNIDYQDENDTEDENET
mmetsp:Transcript_1493/g.2313  ORF Transcript_1493/g.2313 Transcript_1493/m.2313 type:complete len:881 (+) Transcript_1493:452-3094(+)